MKIEIKNRYNGNVIYSHECKDNSIKKTVIKACENNASLCGANLRSADLRGADLRGASLYGASLCDVIGNGREIKTIQTNKWMIVITKKVMAIGCQQHKYKKWMKFTDEEISNMDDDALEFWNNWKKIIKKMHKLGFKS
jgi:uncharacterized protein YjbI with pentapeptide repeats